MSHNTKLLREKNERDVSSEVILNQRVNVCQAEWGGRVEKKINTQWKNSGTRTAIGKKKGELVWPARVFQQVRQQKEIRREEKRLDENSIR